MATDEKFELEKIEKIEIESEKIENESEKIEKHPKLQKSFEPKHRKRHYNCVTFARFDIELLSDGTVSVDGGPAHGVWQEDPDGLTIVWHWAGDSARAKRHRYRLLQPGLRSYSSDDARYNGFLADAE